MEFYSKILLFDFDNPQFDVLMLMNVNRPFKTWKERESSIMFEKREPALVEYLSHQFYEGMWGNYHAC